MAKRKQWKELPLGGKIAGIVLGIIQFGLLAGALADIRRRPAQQVRGPKWVWALAAFINFAGPISYFLFGRKRAPQGLPPA